MGTATSKGMQQELGNPGPGWGENEAQNSLSCSGRSGKEISAAAVEQDRQNSRVWQWAGRKGRRGTKCLSSWEKSEVAATRNSASVVWECCNSSFPMGVFKYGWDLQPHLLMFVYSLIIFTSGVVPALNLRNSNICHLGHVV